MMRRFFSVGLVFSTVSIAGEDGCPVDLGSAVPCGQAVPSLRDYRHHSARDEMYPLEEVEHDSEASARDEMYPLEEVEHDSEAEAVLYPEKTYDPLQKRTSIDDDQIDDEFNELLAHLQ